MTHFDEKPLIVSPWTPDLPLTKADIQSVTVWVQLLGLPLKYWNPEVLGRLTSQLGIPLMPDALTRQKDRGQYARILVHMEIKDTAKTMVAYKDERGRLIHHEVFYEWKPVKCTKCQGYGHESVECRKKAERKEWRPKTKASHTDKVVAQDVPVLPEGSEPIAAPIEPETHVVDKIVPQPMLIKKPIQGSVLVASNQFDALSKKASADQVVEEQIHELVKEVQINKGINMSVVLPIQDPNKIPFSSTKALIQHARRVSGQNPLSYSTDNG